MSEVHGTAEPVLRRHGVPRDAARPRAGVPVWLESLAVTLAPATIALVLRLRLMAPITMADPSMHTIYIVDPQQMYARYAAVMPAGRLREGARVGFLVPARLAYLAFGSVPGFLVIRYLFALTSMSQALRAWLLSVAAPVFDLHVRLSLAGRRGVLPGMPGSAPAPTAPG